MFKNFEAIKYSNLNELIVKTLLDEYINNLLKKLINNKLLDDNNNIENLKKNIETIKINFLIENVLK